MEIATRRRISRVGQFSADRDAAFLDFGVGPRNAGQERFGVGMFGIVVEAARVGLLNDFADVHDGDEIADVFDDAQIMGDE